MQSIFNSQSRTLENSFVSADGGKAIYMQRFCLAESYVESLGERGESPPAATYMNMPFEGREYMSICQIREFSNKKTSTFTQQDIDSLLKRTRTNQRDKHVIELVSYAHLQPALLKPSHSAPA